MVVRRSPAPGDGPRRFRAGPGRRGRGFAAGLFLVVLTAGLTLGGCNTSATPSLPTPDFRAPAGTEFLLRAGDLGLVVGAANYLFIGLSSVGIDTRCPPGETCETPGFLDLNLDIETRENLGSLRLRVPPDGASVGTYGPFEIRTHGVQPDGSADLIPLTEYVVRLSATERETPPLGE